MALKIINDGFKAWSAEEPEKQRLIRAAKTWAHARLSSTDLNPIPELIEGMIVTLNGVRYKVLAKPVLDTDMANPYGLPMIQLTVEPSPCVDHKVTTGFKVEKPTKEKKTRKKVEQSGESSAATLTVVTDAPTCERDQVEGD
jgi:hypothetical protein